MLSFLGILSPNNSPNKTGKKLFDGTYTVGNVTTIKIRTELKSTITDLIGTCPEEAFTFSRVYHQGTMLHSSQYGHSDSKRNSTTCFYFVNGIEHFGTVNYFYHINSQPIAVIKPYEIRLLAGKYLAEKFSNNMRC